MAQSLQISFFLESDQIHGGRKRSLQIRELLQKKNSEVVCYKPKPHIITIRKHIVQPFWSIKLFISCLSSLSYGVTLKGAIYSWYKLIHLYHEFKRRKPIAIFFESSDGLPLILLKVITDESDCPVYALPHNIEGLTPASSKNYFQSHSSKFGYETYIYAKCHKVICISKFDEYVLRINKINAEFLPYFPTLTEEARLKCIADRRHYGIKPKEHFLILGSCANWPTRAGICQLIDHITHFNTSAKFIIAGYNTEVFKFRETANIRVLGEVTGSVLENLLVTTKAMIVHQHPTSGFVTKIVDANLCNIPILITNDYLQASNLDHYGIFSMNISQLEENLDLLSLEQPREYLRFSRNQYTIL